jgi:ATPase family associated with various cellular activities (AAA)
VSETRSAFPDVPHHARGHLGLLFYAAVFQLIYYLRCRAADADRPLDAVLNQYPFLSSYFGQIRNRLPEDIDWDQSVEWLRDQISAWEKELPGPLPLAAMRDSLNMPYIGMLAFIFAGMVEEQAEFNALFASLQDPNGERRVSLGFIQQVLESEEAPEAWSFVRPLVESGFIQVVNRDSPRSEWTLRVPTVLWNAVRGECAEAPLERVRYYPAQSLESAAELLIDEKLRDQLRELTGLAGAGRVRTVVVRGMPGTDRLGAIGAIARELGRGVMEIECSTASNLNDERWRLIGPLCTLTHSIPAFLVEAGPSEIFELPKLGGYSGPITAMIGREGGIGGQDAAHAVTIHLDLQSPPDRLKLWERALSSNSSDRCSSPDLSQIAASFCLPARYIRQCARLATDYAAMERRQTITISDVRWAARAMNRHVLDTLATRVDGQVFWSQLVVKGTTSRELQILEGRCCHREQLASTFENSMPGGMNRGVRALFEGPSGTGKTLAARVLASELGLDLYRVDLAAVINKYIGETEKNLSRVLSRAEDLNIILLLDEGDSLMTRRTEVKSSNDRYANLETNYLLQRLEQYTGIVLITTNAGDAIDSAFRRRMDSVVKFHLPDASERWRLWQVHLPSGHALESDALEEIAIRHKLTGGQIRNVCVNATLSALSDGDLCVRLPHLRGAIQAEHRKAGASFIDTSAVANARNEKTLAAFLGGLT